VRARALVVLLTQHTEYMRHNIFSSVVEPVRSQKKIYYGACIKFVF
jgi:hypothetical protein